MLAVFDDELKKKGTNGIIFFSDAHMKLYISYYFQLKVVQLTKTKKAEIKAILLPLLEHHDEEIETKIAMVAKMSVG